MTVQKGRLDRRFAVGFIRLLVRMFFRRVETAGVEQVPRDRGGILVAWHPNGLVDPALILTELPGRVVFGARWGLFRWPVLGWLMRALGTVPIHRAGDEPQRDADSRRAANRRSIDELARAVAAGRYAALFPEGVSHDYPHLHELKTGAARLYYRACQLCGPDAPAPVIVPVGLHYNEKSVFRSRVLVQFHPPVRLPPELADPSPPDASEAQRRERYRRLTDELERVLEDVVFATESWQLHHLMHRARKLVRAERARRANAMLGAPDMQERRLGFHRVWSGYRARRRTHPDQTEELMRRVSAYDRDLRSLGIEDHELDRGPQLRSRWTVIVLLSQWVLVYLLLPPLLLVGYVVNLPAYGLLEACCQLGSKQSKDAATIKVLGGLVLYPVSWIVAGLLVALGQLELHQMFANVPRAPFAAGIGTFVASALGGVIALLYAEMVVETWHALRVRITRRRRTATIERLLQQRAELYDAITRLAEGLTLPGIVQQDGRITSV